MSGECRAEDCTEPAKGMRGYCEEHHLRLFGEEWDWKDLGLCVVDDPKDLSFIQKPDEVTAKRWARTCSKCEVFSECEKWAEDADGVWAAGEWREKGSSTQVG